MSARPGETSWVGTPLLALVTAGAALAFVLALWLGAYGGGFMRGLAAGQTVRSRSVEGFYGLRELLAAEGLSSRAGSGEAAEADLLVVVPRADTRARALRTLVAGRRALVVLPKWVSFPDLRRPGWSITHNLEPQGAVLVLRAIAPGTVLDRAAGAGWTTLSWPPGAEGAPPPLQTGALRSFQSLSGRLEPVVRDARGATVLGRVPGSQTFVLSDPDLINNGALGTVAGAELATRLVRTLSAGPILFDTSLDGSGEGRSALRLIFEPPFGAACLCLLIAAVLMLVRSFVTFGPAAAPARAYGFGKAALVDSTLSLLRSARREPEVAPGYARVVRSDLARSMGLGSRSPDELDTEFDRLSARAGLKRWSELKGSAGSVRTRAALTAFAADLFHWSQEMKRERR